MIKQIWVPAVFASIGTLAGAVPAGIANAAESDAAAQANPVAQSAKSSEQEKRDSVIAEVVVTGSRIARQDLQSTSPVAVIDGSTFTNSAETNISRILNEQPALTPTRGPTQGSLFSGSFASLRNLGRNRTLVLVNGKRYINTGSFASGVDLAMIPPELIDRVEIVTGGAAATYGSEAVAGVINIILKDNVNGLQFDAQTGYTGESERTNTRFAVTAGEDFASNAGSAYLHLSFDRTNLIGPGDRSFMQETLTNAGDGTLEPLLNPNVPSGGAFVGDERAFFDGNGELFSAPGVINPLSRSDFWSDAPYAKLQQPSDRRIIMGGVNYDIADNAKFYAEGTFVRDEIETPQSPAPRNMSDFLIPVDNPFIGPITQTYLASQDFDGDGYVNLPGLTRRFVELGQRNLKTNRDSWRMLAGFDVDLGHGWSIDTSAMFAESNFTFSGARSGDGHINLVRLARALDAVAGPDGPECRDPSSGCVPINIFGAGNISPEAAQYVAATTFFEGRNADRFFQSVATGDLFELPAGPVGFAGGLEYREREASEIPDHQTLFGESTFGPLARFVGGSDTSEAFAEAVVPLLSDVPMAHHLGVELGLRYTTNDPGSEAWTYKALLDWSPIPQVKFRGGLQHSLRAPNVFELSGGDQGLNVLGNDPCFSGAPLVGALRDACIATGLPVAIADVGGVAGNYEYIERNFGNPDLDSETGDTYTAGIVIHNLGIADLSFTLDYYDMKIDDAIDVVGRDNIFGQCYGSDTGGVDPLCEVILRNATTGLITQINDDFRNTGELAVRGIDLGFNWSHPMRLFREGTFYLEGGGSYLLEQLIVPFAELPDVNTDCKGFYGPACPAPSPEWKSNTRFGWESGPFSMTLTWLWIAGMDDIAKQVNPELYDTLAVKSIPDKHYFDLATSYRFGDSVEVRAGVENIFDSKPPIVGQDRSDIAIEIASFPAQYDHIGRRFYLATSVKF